MASDFNLYVEPFSIYSHSSLVKYIYKELQKLSFLKDKNSMNNGTILPHK